MKRQSKNLQVSILFAYFLFLLAGVSFDNMQKIKNGTQIRLYAKNKYKQKSKVNTVVVY